MELASIVKTELTVTVAEAVLITTENVSLASIVSNWVALAINLLSALDTIFKG